MTRSEQIAIAKQRIANREPRRVPLTCIHEGPVLEWCNSCKSGGRHVHECDIHEKCTREFVSERVRSCSNCTDFRADLPIHYQPIETRNLLYHIYPVKGNEIWRWNVAQLRARLSQFNGKRIIAVAFDATTDSPDAVKDALGPECDYLSIPNNPDRREVATFLPLFTEVQSSDPATATFYAHAKGVSPLRSPNPLMRKWADAMYRINLDYPDRVSRVLQSFPIAGAFLKIGEGWDRKFSRSRWHYSGSFFWFRNAQLFAKKWQRIDQFSHGIEPYLSLHFTEAEAGCLLYRDSVKSMNLYDARVWRDRIDKQLEGIS